MIVHSINRQTNLVLIILLLALAMVSLMVGSGGFGLPSFEAHHAIYPLSPEAKVILWKIRLPRLCLALMVGFGLGISGAGLQGILRNPLAEPGTLGIASMAGLFAVICFYSGLASHYRFALPLAAIGGGLVALLLLRALVQSHLPATNVILAGVAVASLASALTLLAINFAPNPWAINEILQWLMGSLKDRGWLDLLYALPSMILGVLCILACARGLEALALGEETAASLGFPPHKILRLVIIGTSLATGAAVAAAGSVGFVGLMAGHYARALNRQHAGHSLFTAGLVGAALTVAADDLARWLPTAQEINLGVITALLGAPFLIRLTRADYLNRSSS